MIVYIRTYDEYLEFLKYFPNEWFYTPDAKVGNVYFKLSDDTFNWVKQADNFLTFDEWKLLQDMK